MMNPPKNEWMDQWQSLSRQYWNAWQDLTREASAGGARDPANVPWHEGFEQWSRMFGGAGGGGQSETIERVLASAKSFTAFAQQMIAAASGTSRAVVKRPKKAGRRARKTTVATSECMGTLPRSWRKLVTRSGSPPSIPGGASTMKSARTKPWECECRRKFTSLGRDHGRARPKRSAIQG